MVGGGGYLGVSSPSWSKHLAEGSICVGDLQQFLNTRNRNVQPQAELTKAPEIHTPTIRPIFKRLHNFPQNTIGCRQSIQNTGNCGMHFICKPCSLVLDDTLLIATESGCFLERSSRGRNAEIRASVFQVCFQPPSLETAEREKNFF